MSNAIGALRAATRALHARLDHVAYTERLMRGEVVAADYGHFLQTMRALHVQLTQLAEPARSRVGWVAGARDDRLAWLDADLARLGPAAIVSVPQLAPLSELSSALVAREAPWFALGVAYTVEGSSLGGLVQREKLLAVHGLAEHPHRYLAGYGSDTRPRFARIVERLNVALDDDVRIAEASAGACLTFDVVYRVLSAG